MSKKTRAALKAFFQSGDVPTQAQFEDLIDSFKNLTDSISSGDAGKIERIKSDESGWENVFFFKDGYNVRDKDRKPIVTFVFDDGSESDRTIVFPEFEAQGEVAVTAVHADEIGTAGQMTAAQIQELVDAGWEVANHGLDNTPLKNATIPVKEDHLINAKATLESNGWTINNHVWVQGSTDENAQLIAREHYNIARGTEEGLNNYTLDSYNLKAVSIDDNALATHKAWVDSAESQNKWLIFYGHDFTSGEVGFLNDLIDYVQSKGIEIKTLQGALDDIGNVDHLNFDTYKVGEEGFRHQRNQSTKFIADGDQGFLHKGFTAIKLARNSQDHYTSVISGYRAGNDQADIVCIGYRAGEDGSDINQHSIGYESGANNTGYAPTTLGFRAGRNNTGDHLVAVGIQAGDNQTGNDQTAIGGLAGFENTGHRQTAVGYSAGRSNNQDDCVMIGHFAGYNNTGVQSTVVGLDSGRGASGAGQTLLGYQSGIANTGDNLTAVGYLAGENNTGTRCSFLGFTSGKSNTGARGVGHGWAALRDNVGVNAVGIGYLAGYGNQANYLVGIGYEAGRDNTIANRFVVEQRNLNTNELIDGDFEHGGIALGAPSSANKIADSRIGANRFTFFLDEAGNNLTFRVKYADGTTIKEGTVALT